MIHGQRQWRDSGRENDLMWGLLMRQDKIAPQRRTLTKVSNFKFRYFVKCICRQRVHGSLIWNLLNGVSGRFMGGRNNFCVYIAALLGTGGTQLSL